MYIMCDMYLLLSMSVAKVMRQCRYHCRRELDISLISYLNGLVAISINADSKILLQQNFPFFIWGCQIMQVVLYNGHKW